MMMNKEGKKSKWFLKPVLTILSFLFITVILKSQDTGFKVLTIDEAVSLALKNNPTIKNAALVVEKSYASKGSVIDIPSTEFLYQYGQINSPLYDRYIELNQNFGSLLSHINRLKEAKKLSEVSEIDLEIVKKAVTAQVKSAYYYWIYLYERLKILEEESTLSKDLTRFAELSYNIGEINLLEKTRSATRHAQVEMQYNSLLDDIVIASNKLKQLIYIQGDLVPDTTKLELYMIDKPSPQTGYSGGLLLSSFEKKAELENFKLNSARSAFFPEISAGYFNQEIESVKGLNGWQVGLAFPILSFSQGSSVKQARIEKEIALNNIESKKYEIENQVENLLFDLNKYFKQILYYKDHALVQSDLLIRSYSLQYEKEEIDYLEFIKGVSTGLSIELEYLELINSYNQIAIQLELYAN